MLNGEPEYYYIYDPSEVDEYIPQVLENNQGIDFAGFKQMFKEIYDDYWSDSEDWDWEQYEDYFWYWNCFDDAVDKYCGFALPSELWTFQDTISYTFA